MWIYTSAHVVREFEHIKQAGKESGTSGYGSLPMFGCRMGMGDAAHDPLPR